jgi:hypothetical protein
MCFLLSEKQGTEKAINPMLLARTGHLTSGQSPHGHELSMRFLYFCSFGGNKMKKEIDIYDYPKKIEAAVRMVKKASISERNKQLRSL